MEQSDRGNSAEPIGEALEQAWFFTARHVADQAALSLTAAMALDTLNREGPLRLTALAAAEGVSQPFMTELIQRLQRQGLATRVNDPEDGRAALVNVTNAGRALLGDRREDRRARLAELLTALPAEEEATLALAMQVALPIIRRLIQDAANPASSKTTISRSTSRGHTTQNRRQHGRKSLEHN
jgi:DNA-binding MarR family transcriptional regulator